MHSRALGTCEDFPFCTYLQDQSFRWLHFPPLVAFLVVSFPNTYNHELAPPPLLKNTSIWDLLSVFYICLCNEHSSHTFKLYFTTVKIYAEILAQPLDPRSFNADYETCDKIVKVNERVWEKVCVCFAFWLSICLSFALCKRTWFSSGLYITPKISDGGKKTWYWISS